MNFLQFLKFPEWDTHLFIFLNGLHLSWLDSLMKLFSSIPFWIPMYIVILAVIVKKKKIWSIAVILVLGISIAFADQLSVILFKNAFERLRPCYAEELQNVIYSLENCGGRYGFISSHAANSFCFAALTSRVLKNKNYTILIFFWALVVSYSRIYVGKHYPLDIICGGIFGVLCQQLIVWLYSICKFVIFKAKNYEMPKLF